MNMTQDYVTYLRVSTKVQGTSGLGLEGQRAAVHAYCAGRGEIINEYLEVESGRKCNRVQLNLALAECKRTGAVLVIATVSRLARNASFTMSLRDGNVPFVALDCPGADSLTIGVLALVAQKEAEQISMRTKAALAALKARGVKLGNPANLTRKAVDNSIAKRQELARTNEANRHATELALLHLRVGLSVRAIARELNAKGHKTRNGCAFTQCAVSRLLKRAQAS
jgi:DNA invertase Pin-like site-specific DNA recombinase